MQDLTLAAKLAEEIVAYSNAEVQRLGTTKAHKPSHRVAFHWPPHPVSYGFQVRTSDWTDSAEFEDGGETFFVEVAKTPAGVFGRSKELWHEARGETLEEMLAELKKAAQPLLKRQRIIAETLGQEGRFKDSIRNLPPLDLLKLLYCPDRDVAHEAHLDIEMQASQRGIFGPALIAILRDREHPHRRSAQWCVLDLFEDLVRVCPREEEQKVAVLAMRDLIWDADDDYARTTFKAGVVLGGHLPGEMGGPVLIECLDAPSKYGRRSAIHGLYHVVEWEPNLLEQVVSALHAHAKREPEPLLASFAENLARDIESASDHVTEPFFPEELA